MLRLVFKIEMNVIGTEELRLTLGELCCERLYDKLHEMYGAAADVSVEYCADESEEVDDG